MLIDEELLFQNKLKHCELYHENCHLMQYFKCQKYKHIIQICHQNQKCDFYTISKHDDHSCVFQNKLNRYHCTNYEKSHLTWFFKYKTRQKQIEKTWLIYSIRLYKYVEVSTMSVKLDKNIQKSFFQMFLNQSSTVLTAIQSKTFCESLFQNESRNETICESFS